MEMYCDWACPLPSVWQISEWINSDWDHLGVAVNLGPSNDCTGDMSNEKRWQIALWDMNYWVWLPID